MYTFEQKNEIIIRLAGGEHFKKDKTLFQKHCSNVKLERDISRANQFTYATLDARILNELLKHVTESEIIANRQGPEAGKSKKKSTAKKKKSGKKASPKGKVTEKKPAEKDILPAPEPTQVQTSPTPENKKKEISGKSSRE